jgi:hypothetical protein
MQEPSGAGGPKDRENLFGAAEFTVGASLFFMRRRLSLCLSILFPILTAACATYDVTLNDALVYTPGAPFDDYEVADTALAACLQQALVDQQIMAAAELKQLICSHAGISTLDGLGTFNALTQLKLSDNSIRNLMELRLLPALEVLQLDNNLVVDPVPLQALRMLHTLDLSGNDALQCPEPGILADVKQLELPDHCPDRHTRASAIAAKPDVPRR